MEAFAKDAKARFETRMVNRLRSNYPAQTRGTADAELRATIRAGVARAATHSVTDESDVERYLDCVIEHGPEFDRTQWAAPILSNSRLSGSEKMNRIDDHRLHAAVRRMS